jgi:class 3 adenylate cyclase/HAMP domain-containing protein
MKRKVALFLLAVMLSVGLVSTLVVSWEMYRLVSEKQEAELQTMGKILADRFETFVVMLRTEHNRISGHMEDVLPKISADLDAMGRTPGQLGTAELDALAARYGVQHIYFIDRSYKVFQTNLATDMNLQFPLDGPFRVFLDTVFGQGRVMSDGIDLSTLTGELRTYSYFGPKDRDYIIETSTDVRRDMAQGHFGWMAKFFFEDLFNDAVRSNAYVKKVDMFLINDSGYWSLVRVGSRLDPAIARRIEEKGGGQITVADGRLLTVYRQYRSTRPPVANDPVAAKLVISEITYDTGLAREAVFKVVAGALAVLVFALPVVFWIASRLLQRQLLDPLFALRGEAGAIAGGDLDQPIANTGRRDEIGNLAQSFDRMRGAVRKTITDLKQTNLSIERFVPHAFLDMIGKPSIVEVDLGDNVRREMTILFSDIRNFTTLSEAMTPDENFDFINRYLENMGPVIRDNNGFIDKYIGDAIMALFADPDDAVRAGLAMVETLRRYNDGRRAQGLPPIAIGIGLNTGSLMLGTIGEEHRMDGTVISDAVNLAARVESLTKTYRVGILISQFTHERLADATVYDIRAVDVVTVKGKTHPVALFEVCGRASTEAAAADA